MISKLRKLESAESVSSGRREGSGGCFKRTETLRAQTNILISFEPSLIDYVTREVPRASARKEERGGRGRGGGGGDG